METRERILTLVGACNFRDLGGYPTADGRFTRWGRLFRSDTLHELTADDVVVLRQIGLNSVIDLRTVAELERSGRGPLAEEPIAFLHASVLREEGAESSGTSAPVDDDMAERYFWYLDVGRDAFVKALSLAADPTHQPLVFHCAAGKDRTGVLAALILDIVGVERVTIAADYALTGTRMELIVNRLRRDPVWGSYISDNPARRVVVEAATMEGFLALLDQRCGGARQWALDAGVSAQSLDELSAHLIVAGG